MNILFMGCDTWKHTNMVSEWVNELPGNSVGYTMLGSSIGDAAHAAMQRRRFPSRRYPPSEENLRRMFQDALDPGGNAMLIAFHPFLMNSTMTRAAVGYAVARMMPVVLVEHDDEIESIGRWVGYGPVDPLNLLESFTSEVGI